MSQDFDKKADIPMPDWVKNGLGIAQFNGPPDIASVPVSTGVRELAEKLVASTSDGYGEYCEKMAIRFAAEIERYVQSRLASARASEPQYVDLVEAMDDWGCAHDHPEIMREVADLVISNAKRDGRKIGEVRLARASSGEGLREALISIRDMPEYDQDDAHRLREKARAALKSEGKPSVPMALVNDIIRETIESEGPPLLASINLILEAHGYVIKE